MSDAPDQQREVPPIDLLSGGFCVDPAALELEALPIEAAAIVAGAPAISGRELRTWGPWTMGVWQIAPGVVRDVELDEAFVVLSGRATVVFEDGGRLELSPGVAGSFAAGARTTWTVAETLRKVFVARIPGDGA